LQVTNRTPVLKLGLLIAAETTASNYVEARISGWDHLALHQPVSTIAEGYPRSPNFGCNHAHTEGLLYSRKIIHSFFRGRDGARHSYVTRSAKIER
jgi:hypothetical protein